MDPDSFEQEHVHRVYSEISDHFSDTRYKPWPVVDKFMKNINDDSIGVDFGGGNGKNAVPYPHLFTTVLDISGELVRIAVGEKGAFSGLQCSLYPRVCIRAASLDFGLSIACIHHLSTENRRRTALMEMARTLRPGARLLVMVWAHGADKNKSVYGNKNRQLRWLNDQDVMVPWRDKHNIVHERFYHLFTDGELELLVTSAMRIKVVESGYDRDNYYMICEKEY